MRKLKTSEIIISVIIFAIIAGVVITLVIKSGRSTPSSTTTSFRDGSGSSIGIRRSSDGGSTLVVGS